MKPKLPTGIYRHYKGNHYEVLGCARHSENLHEMVIYRALYGAFEFWVRPRTMFLEEVVVQGQKVKRFQFIEHKIPSLSSVLS